MIQIIDDIEMFVVEFDTLPKLPITGVGEEEPYARALTSAISLGVIKKPGKYGIRITPDNERLIWNVYRISE